MGLAARLFEQALVQAPFAAFALPAQSGHLEVQWRKEQCVAILEQVGGGAFVYFCVLPEVTPRMPKLVEQEQVEETVDHFENGRIAHFPAEEQVVELPAPTTRKKPSTARHGESAQPPSS